jgi:hypothetical protein
MPHQKRRGVHMNLAAGAIDPEEPETPVAPEIEEVVDLVNGSLL